MSATPNLAIEHILQSQAQKEVTANEAFDALDQAMSDFTTIDVSAVVQVTPGDYFELIVRQTSGSTKNVAADELTWFAIEVVE